MNLLKQFIRLLLIIIRTLMAITVIWVLVEFIYFQYTGQYLLYYIFWFKSAGDFYEIIHIIGNVNWSGIIFSNYYVPTMFGTSILVSIYDLLKALENKRYVISCLIDIALTITMAFLIFS